jgi:glucose-6-phosphate 1-dehydrogenase
VDEPAQILGSVGLDMPDTHEPGESCILVIFGASGDLTKRLLVPGIYNLACDGLLPDRFAVLGTAITDWTTEQFRDRMNSEDEGIRAFHTRQTFEEEPWQNLVEKFHYQPGRFDDPDHFQDLKTRIEELDKKHDAGGNVLFYLAVAPRFFSQICEMLHQAGLHQGPGWRRIIVEKPFGRDLESAQALNRSILAHWQEEQIFRVDHYLGKETVQNLLAFRFSNGMFEPLWNAQHIDNIQFTVSESVDVGARGGYYDRSGVVRDMMQNHMFQMLAYLCMEPPATFAAEHIRNEKAKLLESVRVYRPEEIDEIAVRGQYGPVLDDENAVLQPGYREAQDVAPDSSTETFAAVKLMIDNWRWQGVPVYLRSGKALWKRSTEIVVKFKKAPETLFRGTDVDRLSANRLVFHIQPYQGIELIFQAKIPGPAMRLQNVDRVFNYGDAFKASRYTGYEVMLYSCTRGDATLFSRGDLVEAAWRVAQPIVNHWAAHPAPDFPNYTRGSWGPKAADHLIQQGGGRWFEIITEEVLERSPLFKGADRLLLNAVVMALQPRKVSKGERIINIGDTANELFLISRGKVMVHDEDERELTRLRDGDFFGEIGLLMAVPRTASVTADSPCDLFVLTKKDFIRILQNHPDFAETVLKVARKRFDLDLSHEDLFTVF